MSIIDQILNSDFSVNWDFVKTIPEFRKLIGCMSNSVYHKEGDTWTHTVLVTNAMYRMINNTKIDDSSKTILMLAALFHDIGKGEVTKLVDDKFKAKGHAYAGEKITRTILWDINITIRESVCGLIRYHMKPLYFGEDDVRDQQNIITMGDECNLYHLYLLKKADCLGCINDIDPDEWEYPLSIFIEGALKFKCTPYCKIFDDTEFEVIIMAGIAGSGKDTYIANNYPNIPTISRDEIRTEIGIQGEKPQGTKEQENYITQIVNERIIEFCKQKQSFIINNTSLKKQYRESFINLVKEYNPYIKIIYIEAPTINDCIQRREGQIPSDIIYKMQKSLDFPKQYEAHELIIIKQKQ